jgi:hypothetical protein
MVKLLVLSIFGMTLLAESPKSATMYVSPQTISIVGGYTPFKDGFVNVFVDDLDNRVVAYRCSIKLSDGTQPSSIVVAGSPTDSPRALCSFIMAPGVFPLEVAKVERLLLEQ